MQADLNHNLDIRLKLDLVLTVADKAGAVVPTVTATVVQLRRRFQLVARTLKRIAQRHGANDDRPEQSMAADDHSYFVRNPFAADPSASRKEIDDSRKQC